MAETTRQDLRRAIGYDLQGTLDGGMIIRTAISAGSKHIIDDGLIGAEDEGRGRWIVIDGHVAVVTGFDPNTNRLSFAPDDPNPPNGETEYELWDQRYNPEHVNSLINQAITDAQVNGVYVPDTIDTAYLPPSAIRIDAPSEWEVVRSVERTFEARGYGIGRSYVDLLQSLESSDDAESDDTFYPFHTVKISGSHSFALNYVTPLGLYDTIGWEVAGNFAGKSGEETEWEFVKQPFDPYSVQIDGAGQAVFPYVAGNVSYVLAAYLYRENQVEWIDSEYIIWQNSGQIELPSEEGNYIYTEGQRLRLQGGKVLTLLNADDQVTSLPASFIRTQALVSLLRAVPDTIVGENGTPIRREWELRAALEMAQLPRMQSVRHLR